jgi:anti-sigma regulatory factor (Ser/Thr protein kinase)
MCLTPSAAPRPEPRSRLLRSLALPEDERAVPLARHQVCRVLRAAGFPAERVNDAALMVSELAANAVTHAKSPYELRVLRLGELMECQVIDGSRGELCFPLVPRSPADGADVAVLAECGRGLAIVSTLSLGQCGCRSVRLTATDAVGKAVYFALPWPDGAS